MAAYFTRSLFIALGGFDPRFRSVADYDLFTRALGRLRFARVERPIARARRVGVNLGATNKDLVREENRWVLERFGLRRLLTRMLVRSMLETWVNDGHPEWTAHTFPDRTKVRMELEKTRLFDWRTRQDLARIWPEVVRTCPLRGGLPPTCGSDPRGDRRSG